MAVEKAARVKKSWVNFPFRIPIYNASRNYIEKTTEVFLFSKHLKFSKTDDEKLKKYQIEIDTDNFKAKPMKTMISYWFHNRASIGFP